MTEGNLETNAISAPRDTYDLVSLLNSVRRFWLLVLALALIGVAGGSLYFLLKPASYAASQQIVVQGVISQPLTVQLGAAASDTSSLVNTQVSIIEGASIQDRVESTLKRTVPPITAVSSASNLTLTLTLEDSSPAAARESIAQYTSTYLSALQSQGATQLRSSVAIIERNISGIQSELRTAKQNSLISGLTNRLTQEQSALDQLEIQLSTGTTVVERVGAISVDNHPAGLSGVSTAAIGAAAGLFGGIVISALLDSLVASTRRRSQAGGLRG